MGSLASEAATQNVSSYFRIGDWVEIRGLVKRTELNGQVGFIAEQIPATGRYLVRFPECEASILPGKMRLVAPAVLTQTKKQKITTNEGPTNVLRSTPKHPSKETSKRAAKQQHVAANATPLNPAAPAPAPVTLLTMAPVNPGRNPVLVQKREQRFNHLLTECYISATRLAEVNMANRRDSIDILENIAASADKLRKFLQPPRGLVPGGSRPLRRARTQS